MDYRTLRVGCLACMIGASPIFSHHNEPGLVPLHTHVETFVDWSTPTFSIGISVGTATTAHAGVATGIGTAFPTDG